jgi:hypothetical protein
VLHEVMSEAKKPDDPYKRAARGGWRLFKWYRRANSAQGWFHWLMSFLGTKTGAALAVVAAGGAAVGTVAAVKPQLFRSLYGPYAVVTERWGDQSTVFPVDGYDKAGRKATFDVVVLTKDFTWERASPYKLQRSGKSLSEDDVQAQVMTAEMRAGLGRSGKVIAVGVASKEGDSGYEIARAQRRSETAARWLGVALPDKPVLKLNLGQFNSTCTTPDEADTSWQRPLIMIGVRQEAAGVVLDEALADALTGKTNLPSPDCYSQFALAN